MEDFVYLGAIVSNEGDADKDMSNRLGEAKVSFGKLRKIWSSKQYSRKVSQTSTVCTDAGPGRLTLRTLKD